MSSEEAFAKRAQKSLAAKRLRLFSEEIRRKSQPLPSGSGSLSRLLSSSEHPAIFTVFLNAKWYKMALWARNSSRTRTRARAAAFAREPTPTGQIFQTNSKKRLDI